MDSELIEIRTGGGEARRRPGRGDRRRSCAPWAPATACCNVWVPHATAGLAVIETGAGSDTDLLAALRDLLPADDRWRHRHGSPGHGRDHVLPALIAPSMSVPVLDGRPALGTWQSICLVDTNSDNPGRARCGCRSCPAETRARPVTQSATRGGTGTPRSRSGRESRRRPTAGYARQERSAARRSATSAAVRSRAAPSAMQSRTSAASAGSRPGRTCGRVGEQLADRAERLWPGSSPYRPAPLSARWIVAPRAQTSVRRDGPAPASRSGSRNSRTPLRPAPGTMPPRASVTWESAGSDSLPPIVPPASSTSRTLPGCDAAVGDPRLVQRVRARGRRARGP